jgi:hypothetical protein
MKIADEGAGSLAVVFAVDSLFGGERNLEVGPGIGNAAGVVLHGSEGVVDVGEMVGGAAGDEIFHEEIGVDAPLGEVADDFFVDVMATVGEIVEVGLCVKSGREGEER